MSEDKQQYYAITSYGVVRSLDECLKIARTMKNSRFKKFESEDEAFAFARTEIITVNDDQEDNILTKYNIRSILEILDVNQESRERIRFFPSHQNSILYEKDESLFRTNSSINLD